MGGISSDGTRRVVTASERAHPHERILFKVNYEEMPLPEPTKYYLHHVKLVTVNLECHGIHTKQ